MIQLPLWSRWVLAVLAFAGLGLLGYALAHGHASTAPTSNQQGTLEANRVGQIVVSQDQAPHQAPLRAGQAPVAAITAAVAADVKGLITTHDLTGPLTAVTCRRTGRAGSRPGRVPIACAATAATVAYPFYGVVDRRARTVVWCKQDAVAEAGLVVPLSPRCLS
jgi:hypothetical protein